MNAFPTPDELEGAARVEHGPTSLQPNGNGGEAPEPNLSRLACMTLDALCSATLAAREQVLAPIIPAKGLAMLYASRGVGKTLAAMGQPLIGPRRRR